MCWRLARQLSAEYAVDVTLWLDDLIALQALLSAGSATQIADFSGITDGRLAGVRIAGVWIKAWRQEWSQERSQEWSQERSQELSQQLSEESLQGLSSADARKPIDIVIEAFACELPEAFQQGLLQQETPPLWINLEYLSAEDWVRECHGLISTNPRNGMQKIFFFPGFVKGTGGLLREQGLLQQHDIWQRHEQQERQQTLTAIGVADADVTRLTQPDSLLISVFTYETGSLASWLEALQHHHGPVLCLIPEGRVLNSLCRNTAAGSLLNWSSNAPAVLDRSQSDRPQPGDRAVLGNLVLQVIPFQSQHEYDHLLSLCDLNLVRGEDSFVRAQWAAKPLLWHIYPQQQDAHLNKLEAFLDLYTHDTNDGIREAVKSFWLDWNTGADCTRSQTRFLQLLTELKRHARNWREKILPAGDIASNLMNFYKNRL